LLAKTSIRAWLAAWLKDRPDDAVLRWVFALLLVATAAVIALDYAELAQRPSEGPESTHEAPDAEPAVPTRHGGPAGDPTRISEAAMRAKMSFDLLGNGRLMAVGTIEPGTAERFAAEIAKRGSYVMTVVLHSPGGSVTDALAMGRLIRRRGFATEVEGTCASSCPLVFAGGTERRAGERAMIGVHQVFAVSAVAGNAVAGMDSGQRISADCQKYLREMGVDPGVWVHAMETPKEQLYNFQPEELLALKLATQSAGRSVPAQNAPQGRVRS